MSDVIAHDEQNPIQNYFGSRNNYLVIPKSLLQSMPAGWQQRFVRIFQEFTTYFDGVELPDYKVRPVDKSGHYIYDPFGITRNAHLTLEDVKRIMDEMA